MTDFLKMTGPELIRSFTDWVAAKRREATGLSGPAVTAAGSQTEPQTSSPPPAAVAQASVPAPTVAQYETPSGVTAGSTLDRMWRELWQVDQNRARLAARINAMANDDPDREQAEKDLATQEAASRTQLSLITQEENRIRDDKKAQDEKKAQPKNGDEQWMPIETKDAQGRTVRGVGLHVYENGVWKYQPGSAKADTGFGSGPQGQGTPGTVLTDGQGAYFMVDPYTGTAKPLNGPAAAVKTINDPDGSVWTQKPDGSKGTKLFDSLPGSYTTPDGRVIGYDRRTGQQVFNIDTQTAEGRALADRLQRATVEAAELANQTKFGSAVAQYQAEAQRRQATAREELERLQDLQKRGQISPDQAEAQFDRWMKLNVEGPLAGFKAAAEEERRKQEQENLTRQRAEDVRVEEANRERGRLAFEAGEAGRREGIEIGKRTRAPEFIRDMGGLAASFSAGVGQPGAGASGLSKTPFQFSPEAFDVANYRKAVPNLNELADAAVNRLLSRVQPATARDVNAPLPALPSGGDLRGMMDSVRYSGPLSAAPQAEEPLPGQAAIDLEQLGQPGRARTVYSNGRYIDWDIPQS